MKTRVIELFEKQSDGNGQVNLIAECNEYTEGITKWTAQLSRSQFTFADTMSDQEIIDWLKVNAYSIYF